ncbi:hypothetical protein DFS34DRAFT_678583 [Phlyctochytrium arcticum]|nr:hypothetical protein DFS34DRAFT_678583 [Phlyctochytrium arcticum]
MSKPSLILCLQPGYTYGEEGPLLDARLHSARGQQNKRRAAQSSVVSGTLDTTPLGLLESFPDSKPARHSLPPVLATIPKKADDPAATPQVVDLSTLDDRTLRRYKRAYKLRVKGQGGIGGTGGKDSRDDLLSCVTKHFLQQEVNEKDTITYFIYSMRHRDNVYKLPPKSISMTSGQG